TRARGSSSARRRRARSGATSSSSTSAGSSAASRSRPAPTTSRRSGCSSSFSTASARREPDELRTEGVEPAGPGGGQGYGREGAGELEDRQPVGEGPEGGGGVGVAADGAEERRGGPRLGARHEPLALQRALGHQPVQVRVLAGEPAVRRCERAERVVALDR